MAFLAPVMLAGAAAVAIPIALHVLAKPRPRSVPWAAMALLRQSVEQSRRRLQFRGGVLLFLRCLIVALLAAAIARPSCSSVPNGTNGDEVDSVFVFDLSYSMGARDGETSRLDRAKAAAAAILDGLPSDSTVQVVTFAGRATHLGPARHGNLDQARQLVAGLTLTGQSGDMVAGLTVANQAVDLASGVNREVYLFTDIQKIDWERAAGAVRAKVDELRAKAAWVVVRCGRPDATVQNVSVAGVEILGGLPHVRPSGPTRVPVAVSLRNTGRVSVRNLTVSLEVDGPSHDIETVAVDEIAAGRTVPVVLTARFTRPGPTLLTVRVSADGLPGDNRFDRIMDVRDRVRVLVVDGRPDARDPRRSASHFLANALVPVPAEQRADYVVSTTVVGPEDAGTAQLDGSDVCFLCDATPPGRGTRCLSVEFVGRLKSFVRAGRGLVIGGGNNVTAPGYNPTFGSAGAGLLPYDLTETVAAAPDRPFTPDPDTAESPGFLARFREPPYSTVTAEVGVERLTAVREIGTSGGRVLMRLSDGRPWLTARAVGAGNVIFVGTSLDASWTDWPAKPGSYLPFVQLALARFAESGTRRLNLTAGEPIVYHHVGPAERFDVLTPPLDGRRVLVFPSEAGRTTVHYADTAAAGVYQLVPIGQGGPRTERAAVNPDLREADDLDVLSDGELEATLGFRPTVAPAGSVIAGTSAVERSRRELTVWILLLAVGVMVWETVWARAAGRPL